MHTGSLCVCTQADRLITDLRQPWIYFVVRAFDLIIDDK